MSVLCVIPARAGSKRIANKNWQDLDGLTLLDWAVKEAAESNVIKDIVVSSDAKLEVINESKYRDSFQLFERPENQRGDKTDIADVVRWLAEKFTHDIIVTLQPATPLRSWILINQMIQTMMAARCNGALTCAHVVPWAWRIESGRAMNSWYPNAYPRSQDVTYDNVQEINTVQIATRDAVMSGKRWDLPLLITELPSWATLDIDTPDDLADARALWPAMKSRFDEIKYFPFHVVHGINNIIWSASGWQKVDESHWGGIK